MVDMIFEIPSDVSNSTPGATNLTPGELQELEAVAQRVATACGRLIVDERPDRLGVAITKSNENDVVTIMDQRSETLAQQLLREFRSQDGIFGEEGVDVAGNSGITWVIDPIDGTVNYLYGIPGYNVSIGAVVGDPRVEGAWRPVAGAVYDPLQDELFSAHRGGGSRLRAGEHVRELAFEPARELSGSLVATGFSYLPENRAVQGRIVAEILPLVRDIRRIGSAAIDISYVAANRVDLCYQANLKAWDMAAAWVIAEEAGAHVCGLDTEYPTQKMALVGDPERLEQVAAILRSHIG